MVNHPSQQLDRVFAALSDPTRRDMISRLAHGSLTVKELAEPLAMSLPATSKHITVLVQAGLLERTLEGRARRCRLRTKPLVEATEWIARNRAIWENSLDALEQYLVDTQKETSS